MHFCPLLSLCVLSCHFLSHSQNPSNGSWKNLCYNRAMKEDPSTLISLGRPPQVLTFRGFAGDRTRYGGLTRHACPFVEFVPVRPLCLRVSVVKTCLPKTRTKSDHFREREFFTPVKSITCNFNPVKCTDFSCTTRSTSSSPAFLPSLSDQGGCTKSSKSANSPISDRFDHAVPTTYNKSKSAYADFDAGDINLMRGTVNTPN